MERDLVFFEMGLSISAIWARSIDERLGGYFQSSNFMGRTLTLEPKNYPISGVTKEFVGIYSYIRQFICIKQRFREFF